MREVEEVENMKEAENMKEVGNMSGAEDMKSDARNNDERGERERL
jgi:hypothetical protein